MTTTARGYGNNHQKLRREVAPIVAAGQARCARCGKPIKPDEPWDLGHIDGTRDYAGPEHSACNRATATHAKARREVVPPSRDW